MRRVHSYYCTFLPFALSCSFVGCLTFLIMYLLFEVVLEGNDIHWFSFWLWMAGSAFFGGLIGALTVVAFPVILTEKGIRSFNFFGLYRTVYWDERVTMGYMNFVGFRYVTMTGAAGIIYIPLFLGRYEDFLNHVEEVAGPDHPLTLALGREAM